MNIRKFWRLSCLTVASIFWTSCTDSNSDVMATLGPQSLNPESSSDVNGSSPSTESASSPATVESSSSEAAQPSSSADVPPASSSEAAAISSAEVASSSSVASYVLARDPSVTCKDSTYKRSNCPEDTRAFTCDDYKIW